MRKLDHKFWILWAVTFGMMLGMSVTLFVIFALLRLNGVVHLYEGNRLINNIELVLVGIGIILSLVMPIMGARRILSGRKVSGNHSTIIIKGGKEQPTPYHLRK